MKNQPRDWSKEREQKNKIIQAEKLIREVLLERGGDRGHLSAALLQLDNFMDWFTDTHFY
jgi:hypothetical protein